MSFSVRPAACRMICASTSVPEPGSSSDTRLPFRSATEAMPESLLATRWIDSGKVGDGAQLGCGGFAVPDVGPGIGPGGDVALHEARFHRAALDGVDIGDRPVRRQRRGDQPRHPQAPPSAQGGASRAAPRSHSQADRRSGNRCRPCRRCRCGKKPISCAPAAPAAAIAKAAASPRMRVANMSIPRTRLLGRKVRRGGTGLTTARSKAADPYVCEGTPKAVSDSRHSVVAFGRFPDAKQVQFWPEQPPCQPPETRHAEHSRNPERARPPPERLFAEPRSLLRRRGLSRRSGKHLVSRMDLLRSRPATSPRPATTPPCRSANTRS